MLFLAATITEDSRRYTVRFFIPLVILAVLPCFGQRQKPFHVEDFRDRHVMHCDLGVSPAPFNLHYPFSQDLKTLRYKNNFKPVLGLAYAYKWFSMRVAFPVLPGFRNKNLFGETQQFSLGFDYNFKRLYTDLDLRLNLGYALKNAYLFDSTFTPSSPHDIQPALGSLNVAAHLWYFHHDEFKMNALQGKRAHFNGQVHTWYLKATANFFGISSENNSIIPTLLHDPENSKTQSTAFSSFDLGLIPGYAYANRIRNWQFSGWAGVGPVVQSKFYVLEGTTNGYIGLAPRYDIRFVGGYSTEKQFVLLAAHFDNKSIRFNDLRYDQYFYTIRLVTGYRIPPKRKASKRSSSTA